MSVGCCMSCLDPENGRGTAAGRQPDDVLIRASDDQRHTYATLAMSHDDKPFLRELLHRAQSLCPSTRYVIR